MANKDLDFLFLTESDKSWLAAAIDFEGSISLCRVKNYNINGAIHIFRPSIRLAVTNKNLINHISKLLGVPVFFEPREGIKNKDSYAILIHPNKGRLLLPLLLPYLLAKKEQAKLLLEVYSLRNGHKLFKNNPKLIRIKEIHIIMKELNKRGK